MPVKLTRHTPPATWKTVDLGDGESFEIQLRSPDYAAQLKNHALSTASFRDATGEATKDLAEFALEAAICDWAGVDDENGKPVPCTAENIEALCTSRPGLVYQLLDLCYGTFSRKPETEAKNSPTPSVDS